MVVTPLPCTVPAMDRDELAEHVVVADLERRRFVSVTPVLRALAEHRAVAHEVVLAHDQRAAQAGLRLDDAARADLNRPFDHDIGTNLDVGRDALPRGRSIAVGWISSESTNAIVPLLLARLMLWDLLSTFIGIGSTGPALEKIGRTDEDTHNAHGSSSARPVDSRLSVGIGQLAQIRGYNLPDRRISRRWRVCWPQRQGWDQGGCHVAEDRHGRGLSGAWRSPLVLLLGGGYAGVSLLTAERLTRPTNHPLADRPPPGEQGRGGLVGTDE